MVSYNLDKINEIRDNMDIFTLEKETQTVIDALIILLGLNVQTKAKTIKKERSRNTSDKIWTRKEEFKVTVMKKTEGVDELLNILRGILNKITVNNYELQSENVYENINQLIEYQDEQFDDTIKYEKIIECFLKVIINNRVYANIYAKLFSELLDKYILLDDYRNYFLDNYEDNLTEINFVDPDEDYDKFCLINKQNEQRKSLLTFLVHSIPTEVHSFEELEATKHFSSNIIGINNRDLNTFVTDIETTVNLLPNIPKNKTVISESGLSEKSDLERLAKLGVSSFLVGESLMKQDDVEKATQSLVD